MPLWRLCLLLNILVTWLCRVMPLWRLCLLLNILVTQYPRDLALPSHAPLEALPPVTTPRLLGGRAANCPCHGGAMTRGAARGFPHPKGWGYTDKARLRGLPTFSW